MSEDVYVLFDIFSIIATMVVNTAPKYYYRQRRSSAVHNKIDLKSMNHVEAGEYIKKNVKEKYPDLIDLSERRLFCTKLGFLSRMVFTKGFKHIPEYKKLLSTLRKNFWFIMRSKHIARNDKIKAVALKINIMLFKWIYMLHFWLEKRKGKILFE